MQEWQLTARDGYRIMLTFETFDTESGYDYVEVSYDSFSQSYSGSSIPGPFTSTGTSMLVKFHTDGGTTRTGFSAVWTETKETSYCPGGWDEFERSCYKFFSDSTDWYTADASCLSYGGRLTSIHSKEENEFLNNLSQGNSYLMGGYPKDNSWVWSDFSDLDYTDYYDMDYGQCMYQNSGEYSSGWNCVTCDNDGWNYICKLKRQY